MPLDFVQFLVFRYALVKLKKKLIRNPLYCYHPLNVVSNKCLQILVDLISELEIIINTIKSTHGKISEHISVLKNIVMNKDDFVITDDLEQEQKIAKRLINAVATLSDSNLIDDVSPSYFAENIRAMLKEYESEIFEEDSPLSVSVVNLENMRMYKTCYFIMCEASKYPRPYIEKFPYTSDICEILSKKEYGIEAVPCNRFGLKYHLNLERYLLKNVLDFVSDELIITFTTKGSDSSNMISLFAKSIAALFGTDIPFESNRLIEEKSVSGNNKTKKIFLSRKDNYTVTELTIFKLCPRLYYHRCKEVSCFSTRLQLRFYAEAVMYCDLLRRFMEYNLNNKVIYSKSENQYLSIINTLHENCMHENKIFFSFFREYELLDISKNVRCKLISFIENSKQYVTGQTFTLIDYKDASYTGDGYTITVEHDNRFVDYEKNYGE